MSDNDKVICPNCTHEFRATPVNAQARISALTEALTECMNQHRALRSEAMRLEGQGISTDFVLAQTDVAVRRARAALKGGET